MLAPADDTIEVLRCFSSRGGTRTPDRVINSHLLYHLSYSGILVFSLQI